MKTWGTIQKSITAITIAVVSLAFTATAYADSFDAQIAALQQQASAAQAAAGAYGAQANDYQTKVNQLNAQIRAINYQIQISQAKYDHLTAEIAANTASLASQKAELGANIKTMYLNASVSPLEILVSSRSISDFFNQQQYRDSVKSKIQSAMAAILALQKQLADEQVQTKQLLADEQAQKEQIAAEQAQANSLLATASQSAAAANAQVRDSNARVAQLRAQQAAAIAAASHHISGGSGCGGYPATWCYSSPFPNDYPDDYGMFQRQCVSYAAWATDVRFNRYMPYWGGVGNAKQWPGNADSQASRNAGITRDSNPRYGDVAIYMGGAYGHAMIVEEVHGSTVRVSSFNGDGTGHYGIDDWPVSSLTFIHFPPK